MTRLFLIRHGRSTANAAGILAGHQDGVELDELGREQAISLSTQLADVNLKAFISSPVLRCVQTADFVVKQHGKKLTIDERFSEMNFGTWQGRLLSELADEALWKDVQERPSTVRFPEGEAFSEVAARASKAIAEWNDLLGDESYAVFTHADVIKVVVAEAIGLPLDRFQRIAIDPCSVTILEYGSARTVLRALNVQSTFVDPMVNP